MPCEEKEENDQRPRGKEKDKQRERERERTGCRKLEGRRSRPGLVLGLADSLALSRRNASNAGEPLLSLSFFYARPSPPAPRVSLSLSLSLSFSCSRRRPPFSIIRGLCILLPSLSLSLANLPFIQFTLSFGAASNERTNERATHANLTRIPLPPFFHVSSRHVQPFHLH